MPDSKSADAETAPGADLADATAATTSPGEDTNTDPPDGDKGRTKARNYGKGFIYLHLADADTFLRKIDSHAKQMSKQGFAVALGHKKPNGRFLHKLEALSEYGLIKDPKASDDVVLTDLAVEMLYGGNEGVRLKGRVAAFLKCEDFKQTFTECPKNQDHPLDYVREFVEAKLGIRNEVDRYLRLFMESAKFAGLMDAEPDPDAKTIKLKPVPQSTPTPEGGPAPGRLPSELVYRSLAGSEADQLLDSLGLMSYAGRAQVAARVAGKVSLKYENGDCVLEVNRPFRVSIGNADALTDVPDILKTLKEGGYDF